MTAMMEMYLQGVSTRKVKAVTEELCGHGFRSSSISRIVARLDEELEKFARRQLEDEYPYLVLKVRENGAVRSQAVLIAIGIDWEGRRNVLAIEMASRESTASWKEFLAGLRERGLRGVQLTISDDHAGLKRAIREALPEAGWQRCYVHFLRNALDYLPRKADDDCLMELRWLYEYAGADHGRAETAHAGGAHLSRHGQLSEAGAGACRGNARELDRGDPVSEYGTAAGTE